jgi:tRNA(fMet)-specific endonuclease VapC
MFGVERNAQRAQALSALRQLLETLEVAGFDTEAAYAYGRIRNTLEKKGVPIGPLDYLIAAHALSLGTTLVTNNEREFNRVPGLQVENWV